MAQANLSIYITSESIRITEIKKIGGSIHVSGAFTIPTPPGSVDDGLITDVESVAKAISEAINETKKKKAKLYFTVYSRKIAAKEIDIPYMKKIDVIGDMINANLDDYFPMGNLDDYITRYTILNTIEHDDGRKAYHICVYAVLKELIASYFKLAKALKMPLASIDYQVNSLYHLAQWQNRQGTSLILQIDDDVTHISIFKNTSQLFRRSVPYGVDTFAQALAASKGMSEEEARAILLNIKDEKAIKAPLRSVAALRQQAETLLINDYLTDDEYDELIHDFIAAISRVVDFFVSKYPNIILEKIKVIGSGVKISHLDKALKRVFELDVELIKRLSSINIRRERGSMALSPDELTYYLPNIGALIKPLDLRLPEEVSFRKGGIGIGLFIALVAIAIAVVGAIVVFLLWQETELEREKNNLTRIVNNLQYVEDIVNDYERAIDYYALIEAFDNSTNNENEALYQLILTLEKIMPSSVTILQLQASDGNISLTVNSANGKLGVARFIIELEKIPWIDDIWVSNIRDAYDDFGNINSVFPLTFTISNRRLMSPEDLNGPEFENGLAEGGGAE